MRVRATACEESKNVFAAVRLSINKVRYMSIGCLRLRGRLSLPSRPAVFPDRRWYLQSLLQSL
jgi:hypothetical protein